MLSQERFDLSMALESLGLVANGVVSGTAKLSYDAQDIPPNLTPMSQVSLLQNDAWLGKVAHTCNPEGEFETSLDT